MTFATVLEILIAYNMKLHNETVDLIKEVTDENFSEEEKRARLLKVSHKQEALGEIIEILKTMKREETISLEGYDEEYKKWLEEA